VSTQLSWNIVCQCMVDTESKFVRMSLTKYSIYNLAVTLCVSNTSNKWSVHNLGVIRAPHGARAYPWILSKYFLCVRASVRPCVRPPTDKGRVYMICLKLFRLWSCQQPQKSQKQWNFCTTSTQEQVARLTKCYKASRNLQALPPSPQWYMDHEVLLDGPWALHGSSSFFSPSLSRSPPLWHPLGGLTSTMLPDYLLPL
jgi:hypothetical protein